MSNPAVITLSSVDLKNNINFRIEDNIGECIHIHYANYRFDFSVKEFLELEKLFSISIENCIGIEGFKLKDFDILFLASIADKLIDLEKIKFELASLSDLKVYGNQHGFPKLVNIDKSMILKSLNDDNHEYLNYKQENFFEESNENRLERVKNFINTTNLRDISPIILFNKQNAIRDGQHRSAILFKNKIKEIQSIRLIFKDNKHNLSLSPIFDLIFKWNLDRLKEKYRSVRSFAKSLKKRISYKLYIISRSYYK
jgi:hypothetical protein